MEFYTKNELVERFIREAIAKGDLQPGERLLQNELAKKMGMSSTPIREALRSLQAQGVLVHAPNKGVRVADIQLSQAKEVYLIRSVLEPLTVEIATKLLSAEEIDQITTLSAQIEQFTAQGQRRRLRRVNHDLHFLLYGAAQMPLLRQMIEVLWTLYPWDTLYVIPGRAEASVEEHRRLVRALHKRDAAEAAAAMRDHIVAGCEAVLEHLAAGKEPTAEEDSPRATV